MKTSIIISLLSLWYIGTSTFSLSYPEYIPTPSYDFSTNPLDSLTIQLGRVLFYDAILSQDNTISCASCHSPYNAFAHTDHELSHGIHDSIGTRNAPPLFNLAWQSSFMWDGSIHHLDVQALAPISHPGEMGESIQNIVRKINTSSYYPSLFNQCFGDSIATGERILKALAQFQLSLVSFGSKYDAVQQEKDSFTLQEKKGEQLFMTFCNSCHRAPLFSSYGFANNGLSVDTTLHDYGKWLITHDPNDSLLFKIPSLRNLSYTYPYMHDGRFQKLREVLHHYTNQIIPHPTLSPALQQPISLDARQKTDLIAFLRTLNDNSFIFDKENKFPQKILLSKD
jgi:cytochrome c peroxidase